jgi:hypothetical protein
MVKKNQPEGLALEKVVIFVSLCKSKTKRRKTGKFSVSVIGKKAMAGGQEIEPFN